MRKFKHEKTKWIAETHPYMVENHYRLTTPNSDNTYVVPAWMIELSSDWEEVIEKDYEVLDVMEDQIYSVKRLSDGEVFSVGDYVEGRAYEVAPKYGFSGIVTAIDEVDGNIFIRWAGKNAGVASLKFFVKSRLS